MFRTNGMIVMLATLVLLFGSLSLIDGQAAVILSNENAITNGVIEEGKENKQVDVQAVTKCTTITNCVTKGYVPIQYILSCTYFFVLPH